MKKCYFSFNYSSVERLRKKRVLLITVGMAHVAPSIGVNDAAQVGEGEDHHCPRSPCSTQQGGARLPLAAHLAVDERKSALVRHRLPPLCRQCRPCLLRHRVQLTFLHCIQSMHEGQLFASSTLLKLIRNFLKKKKKSLFTCK